MPKVAEKNIVHIMFELTYRLHVYVNTSDLHCVILALLQRLTCGEKLTPTVQC